MVLGKDTKEVHLGKPFYWAWIKSQVLRQVVCQEQWVKPLLLPSNSETQAAVVVKNLPANARDVRNAGSVPGLRRSPGEGNGSPLQYSRLENPMDRGAWWATVHRVTKSWTRLKWFSIHTYIPNSESLKIDAIKLRQRRMWVKKLTCKGDMKTIFRKQFWA